MIGKQLTSVKLDEKPPVILDAIRQEFQEIESENSLVLLHYPTV
jgi:hypothetical protein